MDRLYQIIAEHGRLKVPAGALDDDTDLFAAGMDSLGTVNLLMVIEDAFAVEFPDDLLNRGSFATPRMIRYIVGGLRSTPILP